MIKDQVKLLDNIPAGQEMLMTEEMKVAFKYGGCSPTACHACGVKIKVGDKFKLHPHRRDRDLFDPDPVRDEMLCGVCGEPELVARDARDVIARRKYSAEKREQGKQGYSRPHKSCGESND